MNIESNGSTWDVGFRQRSPHHSGRYLIRSGHIAQTAARDDDSEISLESALVPGQAATKEVLEDLNRRMRLAGVINRLFSESNEADFDGARLSKAACLAGKLFIDALPVGTRLPKVAPDGEGGLIFAWISPGRSALLTLDGTALHFVDRAGTPQAEYFDSLPFARHVIPQEIADAVTGF